VTSRWPTAALGEVLRPIDRGEVPAAGVAYRQIGVRLWGEGAYEREILDGGATKYASLKRVEAGDIIVNKIWARNGSVAVVSGELAGCYASAEFPTFVARSDGLDPRWFHWITKARWFWQQCEEASQGTSGKNRIRPEKFLEVEIPLPPLEEQRRIVAKLDAIAAEIGKTRTLRQQAGQEANALVASVLVHLYIEGLARGWVAGKLGDYVVGDCYGSSEKTTEDASGVPILRMGNIQNGRLDTTDLKYLHLPAKDRPRLLLKRGDVLVNRTNSAELVGKCAVFDVDEEFSFASYLIRLRLDQERADPRLVAALINSPLGRAFMLSEKRQMTGQANVNATKLKAFPLALPSLDEQRQVVTELDALQAKADTLRRLQGQAGAELDLLMPSLLDRACRGEL
jgi:type I restriction enzyme, S subunit